MYWLIYATQYEKSNIIKQWNRNLYLLIFIPPSNYFLAHSNVARETNIYANFYPILIVWGHGTITSYHLNVQICNVCFLTFIFLTQGCSRLSWICRLCLSWSSWGSTAWQWFGWCDYHQEHKVILDGFFFLFYLFRFHDFTFFLYPPVLFCRSWSDAVLWNPHLTMESCYKDFVCVENAKVREPSVVCSTTHPCIYSHFIFFSMYNFTIWFSFQALETEYPLMKLSVLQLTRIRFRHYTLLWVILCNWIHILKELILKSWNIVVSFLITFSYCCSSSWVNWHRFTIIGTLFTLSRFLSMSQIGQVQLEPNESWTAVQQLSLAWSAAENNFLMIFFSLLLFVLGVKINIMSKSWSPTKKRVEKPCNKPRYV